MANAITRHSRTLSHCFVKRFIDISSILLLSAVTSTPAEELNRRLIYGNKPQFSISCSYSIIPPLKRQAISVFFTKGTHTFPNECYRKYNTSF
jgi:hypothetical protein